MPHSEERIGGSSPGCATAGFPTTSLFPDLKDEFSYIVEHMNDAGRDAVIDVAPYVPAAVSEDPDVAKDTIRSHVAYYVGNGRGYDRAVAQRFPDGADSVAEAWRTGDRGRAVENVTDEMVEAFDVAGMPQQAREQFRRISEVNCVTCPMETIPRNADDRIAERTIEELAPSRY